MTSLLQPLLTSRRSPSLTKAASYVFSSLALGTLGVLVLVFAVQSIPVWRHEGLGYITGAKWFYRDHIFGALPMIYGTVVVAFIALVLAAPIGIGAAIFTSEFLPRRLRIAVKITVESTALIEELILQLKERHTIILVTHNVQQARRVTDWLACLCLRDGAGEIAESACCDAMLENPQCQEVVEYLSHA